MSDSSLKEFIESCHNHYACFSFAKMGLESAAAKLQPHIQGSGQRLFIGNSDPNEGKPAQASVLMEDAVTASSKNGKYHDQLAKLIVVYIYAEWDELYRPKIAKENSVETKSVSSDLMGDLRHIRNCIIHNKSVINKNLEKLKVLEITQEQNKLVITEDDLAELMNFINDMAIEVA